MPAKAPLRLPRRQYKPKSTAGAHCVTAMNDRSPISTRRNGPASIRAHRKPRVTTTRMPRRVDARLAEYTSSSRRRRRRNGRTMSLEIIFESARESTTIMAVAAEKPPRNTVTATSPASARSGSARMKLSAEATSPNVRRPPKAMGSTKTLIARR